MSDPLTFAPQYRIATQGRITIITCAGWDGVVESIPREQIAAYLSAHHADRVGAYVLLGDDEQPFTYIGSGVLPARLTRHLADPSKGRFGRAIIFYAPSGWLTNSRAAYLEANLYRAVCAVGQVRVLNGVTPAAPRLDGIGDVTAMRFWQRIAVDALRFLDAGILVERLPRVYAPLHPATCGCSSQEEVFRLASTYGAFLVVRGDEHLIRAGSLGRLQEGGRWAEDRGTGWARREELLDAGTLRRLDDGEHVVAVCDIPVTSPSAASCILTTQETSGQTAWRHVRTGQTYSEFFATRAAGLDGGQSDAA